VSVDPAAAASFDALRPVLTRVAYRMLGSVADAEDVVQDAWLRWADADRSDVRTPEAYLRRVVTRLCLDRLKSAHAQREEYIGPWLPEPIVEQEEVEDVTLPLMLALERLSPLERAAFLLHDVFGESFEEVAASLDRDPAACRQLASRAREHVRSEKPRFDIDHAHGMAIATAFFAASRSGEIGQLRSMLASDVTFYSDGGGKRPAASRILSGIHDVTRAHSAIARLSRGAAFELVRYTLVNGLPGFITREADGVLQTTALLIEDGRIRAIYVMRNPDKLRHIDGSVH
jgi:RNA polymerase sigma-70 factor (ECF subfamily)